MFQTFAPEDSTMEQSSCRIAPKQRETTLELPPPDTKRWSSRRKEELADWEVAVDKRGIPGLRSAALHIYRDGPKPSGNSVPVRERA